MRPHRAARPGRLGPHRRREPALCHRSARARALAAPVATIAPGVAATVAAPGLIAPASSSRRRPAARAAAGADAAGGVAFGALAAGVGAEAGLAAASEVGAASWRQPP
jgi:hypothetical protein